jgi:hypothetical protein
MSCISVPMNERISWTFSSVGRSGSNEAQRKRFPPAFNLCHLHNRQMVEW